MKSSIFWEKIAPGVWKATDGSGREKCSPAELKRRKMHFFGAEPTCIACKVRVSYWQVQQGEVELAHRASQGLGGGKTNDSWENLAGLMHKGANRAQGGMPLETYLAEKWKPEDCKAF
jgi:hypothetical protein